MSKAEQYPFGAPGEEWSNLSARRRRSPRRFDADVRPRLRELWEAGDWAVKSNILAYVVTTTFDEGWDVVWQTLDLSPSQPEPLEEWLAVQGTAVIAAMRYVDRGHAITDQQVDRLKQILLAPGSDSTRGLTELILGQLQVPDFWELIDGLRSDPSPDMRFSANMELLRVVRDVKAELLADLDKLRYPEDGLNQLWWERARLGLTDSEEGMLRARLVEHVAKRRDWASEAESDDAHGLARLIQQDLPYEEGDIDLIARGALQGWRNYVRIFAVRDVAWFGNERAVAWLETMTLEPYRPAVRREARKQLHNLQGRAAPK